MAQQSHKVKKEQSFWQSSTPISTKLLFIANSQQDPELPELSDSGAKQAKKSLFLSVFEKTSIISALAVVIVFPLTTHAGFFDALSRMFTKVKQVQVAERPVNSQNMNILQAATNPDPNPAKGGGDITMVQGSALLSENGPSGTIADVNDHPGADHISIYVVRPGDSLSGIAKLFGVTVNTVVWANDIKKGAISPGQTLIILPISGVEHTVVKGDTLASLAKKYKADADEIAQFNNIADGEPLSVWDVVIIPDGEIATPAATPKVGSKGSNPYRGGSGPSLPGYYMRPLAGSIETQGLHGYNGVDLSDGHIGSPILAAAEGDVIISRNYGYNGGYGSYIVISHPNGTQTLYAHLSQNLVFEGYHVVQGQMIGKEGMTGKATGPHVHFEVRGAKNPF